MFLILVIQVFLNLTNNLTKDKETEAELSEDGSSCTMENDDFSVSNDNFTERDGMKSIHDS